MVKPWYQHLADFVSGAYEKDRIKDLGVEPLIAASLTIGATGYRVKSLILQRLETSDEGTFGKMVVDGMEYVTLELPDRGNSQGESCIPAGTYTCTWDFSPAKQKNTYRLINVPGRSGILIHSANWAGDAGMGYRSELLGCIALGLAVSELEGQKAIISSRAAMEKFEHQMAKESFEISILPI